MESEGRLGRGRRLITGAGRTICFCCCTEEPLYILVCISDIYIYNYLDSRDALRKWYNTGSL